MKHGLKLTPHFALSEFLVSATATRLGITEQFEPTPSVILRLAALCVNVLEPLRVSLGVPVRITSGYRCPRLNAALAGASPTSQHKVGEAADLQSLYVSNAEILDRIVALGLPFDQLITEFPDKLTGEPAWIHVSYSARHRRQILKAEMVGGKVTYRKIVLG